MSHPSYTIVKTWMDRNGMKNANLAAELEPFDPSISVANIANYARNDRGFPQNWELTKGIINVFTKNNRLAKITAQEALDFVTLMELPLKESKELAQLFPKEEWRLALNNYFDHIFTYKGDSPIPRDDRPYSKFIGREEDILTIKSVLVSPSDIKGVIIDGLGGLGKSSVAYETCFQLVSESDFDRCIWISTAPNTQFASSNVRHENFLSEIREQMKLPLLSNNPLEWEQQLLLALKTQKVLLVLDNMETSYLSLNQIISLFKKFLGKSKLIVTSRVRFNERFDFPLFQYHLRPFDLEGTEYFIRYLLKERRIENFDLTVPLLKRIFEVTSGVAHAIRLVVSQMIIMPIGLVLEHLTTIKPLQVETKEQDAYLSFYRHIYLWTWESLSEAGQSLLIAMGVLSPGIGIRSHRIQRISDLEADSFKQAVNELWRYSFLEISNIYPDQEPLYSIHSLTYNFIHNDIVKRAWNTNE